VNGPGDRDFDEFARLWPISPSDVERWAERDRQLDALRDTQNRTAEIAHMRARRSLLHEGGFPEEALRGALLANPIETSALKHARKFQMLPSTMLVLAGGVGVGKTTAATWAALKRDDAAPGFVRAGDLERRGRYHADLERWLKERTSLVIDDLASELLDSKGVFSSLLDNEVDRAYSKRSILILTTNVTEDQIAARYGARMWSRFQQRGLWASCGMRDLRREVP
jgi:DNA replication protein DnaC